MAGDWIKMRSALATSPKVNGIARLLENDPAVSAVLSTGFHGVMSEIVTRNVMRNVTVATLLLIWGTANEHTHDGIFKNADLFDIDDIAGIPNFGQAMAAVGWAIHDEKNDCVILPNFNEYNTSGSQRSAATKSNAQRQKEYRERQKNVTKNNVTDNVTNVTTSNHREEKRREEDISTTTVVDKRSKKLPDDFAPNEWHADFAANNNLNLSEQIAQFSDYHNARGSTMKDWNAALRTWLRNAVNYRKTSPSAKQNYFDHLQNVSDQLTGRATNAGITIDVDKRLIR